MAGFGKRREPIRIGHRRVYWLGCLIGIASTTIQVAVWSYQSVMASYILGGVAYRSLFMANTMHCGFFQHFIPKRASSSKLFTIA